MKRLLPFLVIVFVFGVALVFSLHLWRSGEKVAGPSAGPPGIIQSGPGMGAQPPHVKGSENASVLLEEFADFECQACAKFYPIWKSLEREYGGRVRVTFRHFPLVAQHKRALSAAYAAEAAGLQGKFWEMHNKLFENRETWSKAIEFDSIFLTYAQEIGLDLDRFKQDQANDIVRLRVNQDFQRGRALEVKATPTLFVNGSEVPYRELKTVQEFRKILDNALKESG